MIEGINPDVLLFIMGQLVCCAALYGGIRADLRNMHRRADEQEEATKEVRTHIKDVHTRIDQMFQSYWQSSRSPSS